MAQDYKLTSNNREPRPRSKRLRELGAASSTSGHTVVIGDTGGNSNPTLNHTHDNKAALDQISTDRDGYQYLSRNVEIENNETGETEVQGITEKVKAGYADMAHDLDPDSPVRNDFLSKLKDDRSVGKISSDKGFEVGKFVSGVAGGFFGMDANGDSLAEVARLYVRVKAFFEELTVIKSNVLAGKQYITPGGGITCLRVEELDDVYRCYFLSEQDGEKTEAKIIVGDQAISEMFNAKAGTANKVSNHRYWRLVTAVSNDAYTDDSGNHYGYIDLSKTDCESGSDIPQTGDEICQLGYRGTDKPERQTAMIFSTVDSDAPSIKMFSGIGSGTTNAGYYSLAGKVIISFGRDTITGKIFFRLGATGATQYLEYTQDGGLEIAGAISTKSTIDNKPLKEYIKDQAGEATTLLVEYSPTGADGSWHATFAQGDLYMRQSTDNGETWEGPMRIVGVNGENYSPNLITQEHYYDNYTGAWLTNAYMLSAGANPSAPALGSGTVRWQLASGIIKEAGWYSVMLWAKREKGEGRFWVDINDCKLSDAVIVPEDWTQYKWSVYVDKLLGMYGFLDLQTDSPNCAILISDVTVIPGKNPLDTWIPAASEMVGKDGQYHLCQWAIGTSTAVTGAWQDTPVTALPGQYVWMRSGTVIPPATAPAQWSTPIRLTGDSGHDGESTYLLDLTNETEGVACDSLGNPTGALPSTDIKVYKGATVDTGWTFTKADNGCQSMLTSANTLQITSLDASANTATVTVTATKAGCPTLTTVMNIYKVIPGQDGVNGENGADGKDGAPGADGKPATVFRLLPSVDSVTRHADGSLSAAAVTCTVLKTTGDATPTPSNEHTLWYQRMPDGVSGTLTRTNGVSGGVSVLASTEAIIFELRSGNTVLDRERVPVLSDLEDFGMGGENLLLNAGLNTKHYWESWALESAVIDAEDKFEGSNVLKIDVSGKDEWYGQGLWQTPTSNPHLKAEPDTYYSFGVWVYSPDVSTIDNSIWMGVQCKDASGNVLTENGAHIVPSKNGVWEHKVVKFKTPATVATLYPRIFSGTNGKLWLSKPQLVRGAVLPDWAPSPYDFDYVTEALKNSGSFEGGLLLGSLIKLGYTDEEGNYHIMAGLNGITQPGNTGRDAAFWGGGEMIDADVVSEGAATAMIRQDGTAYFSGNVIRLLKDHVMIGDDVRLDTDGLKLMADGSVKAVIRNKPVEVDFDKLAGGSIFFGSTSGRPGAPINIPISLEWGVFLRFTEEQKFSYNLGVLPSNATGSVRVRLSGQIAFSDADPKDGVVHNFCDAQLRLYKDDEWVWRKTIPFSVQYSYNNASNKSSGIVSYSINETAVFNIDNSGIYRLELVIPENFGTTVGLKDLGTLSLSNTTNGEVKRSLGSQTTIGSDGFVSSWENAAIAVNKDRAILRAGGFGLIVDASKGIQYIKDGGSPQQLV